MKVPDDEGHQNVVLWTSPEGLSCVLASYDGRRYQLKLLRRQGTVKTELFESYAQAAAAASGWREQVIQER
jgi:hypothetical protein